VPAKPFQDIADFIGADPNAAVALATAIPNLQDGHGQQCWIAMQLFGAIIKAHPVPITFHVINDYESLRLLGIATNTSVPTSIVLRCSRTSRRWRSPHPRYRWRSRHCMTSVPRCRKSRLSRRSPLLRLLPILRASRSRR